MLDQMKNKMLRQMLKMLPEGAVEHFMDDIVRIIEDILVTEVKNTPLQPGEALIVISLAFIPGPDGRLVPWAMLQAVDQHFMVKRPDIKKWDVRQLLRTLDLPGKINAKFDKLKNG